MTPRTPVVAVALTAVALLGGAAWWSSARSQAVPAGVVAVPTSTGTSAGAPSAGEPTGTGAPPTGDDDRGPAPAARSGGPAGTAPIPTAPPQGVTWQVWRTIALPYSPSAGPARVQGDVAGGFARTPAGALLAAVHASSRKVAAGDGGWRDVARAMLAPGAGRDAWIAVRGRARHPDAPEPGTFAQVAGFQFVSYTGTDAVVQLVSRAAEGGFSVVAMHLAWLDGDWRLVLAPDGGDATSRQRTTSLAGFVAWGGV